jgi:hypothetical protein
MLKGRWSKMGSRGTKEESRKISGLLLALLPRQYGYVDVIVQRWEESTSGRRLSARPKNYQCNNRQYRTTLPENSALYKDSRYMHKSDRPNWRSSSCKVVPALPGITISAGLY